MILTPASHDSGGRAELLSELRAGPFLVTHKRYSSDFTQGFHEHETGSIDFILEGGGKGVYAGRELVSIPGTVEFFREEVRHNFIGGGNSGGGGGIRTMHVVIPGDMLRRIPGLRDISLERLTHTRSLSLAILLLGEIHQKDRSASLVTESVIHELVDEIAQASARPSTRAGWIGSVRDYLHAVQDRPVTLQELANHAGVHRSHLARVFKCKLGLSVGAYHRGVRIQLAAQHLARKDASIARVSNKMGFADQAHLTRMFRERIGVTPNQYRQCLRLR
jgi:AraC-like DNA-binding protein